MARRGSEPTLEGVGEFGFLARLLPQLPQTAAVRVGPGDDAAVVDSPQGPLLLTTDALVEGVHFQRDWMSATQLGRRAYLVNASDIAAMGGQPLFCVASVSAPAPTPVRELRALHRGLAAAAAETGAALVGGNLSRAQQWTISVALLGSAEAPVTRIGAQPGDLLFVTGTLGDAALGLRALQENPRARGLAVRRFREPPVRLRAGRTLAGSRSVSALIDISDGLLQDLGHLCRASRVGAEVEIERIPCRTVVRRAGVEFMLAGGEDYELLCAVPPVAAARLPALESELGCRLTRVGRIVAKRYGVRVKDGAGRVRRVARSGFDHFRLRGNA